MNEPREAKLVELQELPPPPDLSIYQVWAYNGEDWECDGNFPTLYRATNYAALNCSVYRIFHVTDAPRLPDREKLARHLVGAAFPAVVMTHGMDAAYERSDPETALREADAVITLLRDGVPEELY